jgi:hypothetical protein
MRAIRLEDSFRGRTPKLFHRDDVLTLKMNRWKEQGRGSFFETASRLINPLSALPLVIHPNKTPMSFFKAYEIFVKNKDLFQKLPKKFRIFSKEDTGIVEASQLYFGTERTNGAKVYLATVISFENVEITLKKIGELTEHLCNEGALLVALGEMYQSRVQLLLWVLYQLFEDVRLYKPLVSNVFDNEKFAICNGFTRKIRINITDWGKLLESCPLPWFSYISEIESLFQKEKEIAQRRAENLTKLLVFHRPFANANSLGKMSTLCLSGSNIKKYCKKYIDTLELKSFLSTTTC